MNEKKKNMSSRRDFIVGSSLTAIGLSSFTQAESLTTSSSALNLAEGKREELINLLSNLITIRSQTGESAEEAQLLVNSH